MAKENENMVMTQEELAKASAVIGQVLQSYNTSPEQVQVEENPILNNPSRALLSEEVIQNAPDYIVVLAAFIGEFADAVSSKLEHLERRIDQIIVDSAKGADAVLKATESQMTLMKALKEVPAKGFEHAPAFTPRPLLKAEKDKPTKAYIISKLEDMIKEGKASVYSISNYEASGRLPQEIEEAILASWNSDKVNV